MSSSIVRSAKSELCNRIRDYLELRCKTEIPKDDNSRVNQVVVGRYTGELLGIILSVHGDHPLGPFAGRHDGTAEGYPRRYSDRPWNLPAETIGGSKFEVLYGTVQLRMLKSVNQATSLEIVDVVMNRVTQVIENEPILPIVDQFGNRVFYVGVLAELGYYSGSDDTGAAAYWCDFTARVSRPRTC